MGNIDPHSRPEDWWMWVSCWGGGSGRGYNKTVQMFYSQVDIITGLRLCSYWQEVCVSFLSVFPTVDFNRCGMRRCIVGGRKEKVQQILAAGWPARCPWMVFAPLDAKVVRESNTRQTQGWDGKRARTRARLNAFFSFDPRGILQRCKVVKSPQFMEDLAELLDYYGCSPPTVWLKQNNKKKKRCSLLQLSARLLWAKLTCFAPGYREPAITPLHTSKSQLCKKMKCAQPTALLLWTERRSDLWAIVICVQSVTQSTFIQGFVGASEAILHILEQNTQAHLVFVAPFLRVVVKIAPTKTRDYWEGDKTFRVLDQD